MATKKSIAVMTAGAGAGVAQTFILREYVDKVYGPIPGLDVLGGFGTYSALGGVVTGGITTAAGLLSVLTGKITRSETVQLGLLGYGIPALGGAILSGLFPVAVGLRARVPGVRLKTVGVPTVARPPNAARAAGVIRA